MEAEEDWQRGDHVPTDARIKLDEAIERNSTEEEARHQAVIERARANGTLRADATIVTRRVAPETIRPPGWEPIPNLVGASQEKRRDAVCIALKRGPMTAADIFRLLKIKPAPKLIEQLLREGRVTRGVVELGETRKLMVRLAEKPPSNMRRNIPPTEEKKPVGLAEQHRQHLADTAPQRDDPVERVLEMLRHGPMRQADIRRRLGVASPMMASLVPKLRVAGVVFGDDVNRSPMLSAPGTDPYVAPAEPGSDSGPSNEVEESEVAPDEAAEPVEIEPRTVLVTPHEEARIEFPRPLHGEYMALLRRLVENTDGELGDRLRARYARRLMDYAEDAGDMVEPLLDEIEAVLWRTA